MCFTFESDWFENTSLFEGMEPVEMWSKGNMSRVPDVGPRSTRRLQWISQ